MGRPKCSPERDTHCDKRKIGILQNQRRTLGRGLRGRQYHPFEIIALLNFAPVFVFDFVGIRNIYSSQWVSLSGEHFGRPIKEIHPYSEVFKKPHFSGRPTKKKPFTRNRTGRIRHHSGDGPADFLSATPSPHPD